MGWLDNTTATAFGSLTWEDLERTFEALVRPRPPHRHIVSSTAIKKPGTWTLCADCGQLVRIPER